MNSLSLSLSLFSRLLSFPLLFYFHFYFFLSLPLSRSLSLSHASNVGTCVKTCTRLPGCLFFEMAKQGSNRETTLFTCDVWHVTMCVPLARYRCSGRISPWTDTSSHPWKILNYPCKITPRSCLGLYDAPLNWTCICVNKHKSEAWKSAHSRNI